MECKIETFGEKVKKRILEENKEPTATQDKLKQQLQKVVSHEIKELPAHYSTTLQNKLPPKETDLGSFFLPCIIGNHPMTNALADLGASISVMTYSLFKRLGLGSLKPIKMAIEMVDRSMQSPKGIKENVLVRISNFVFSIDFIILDIMEDENVPTILGRPMLATAHAKIDVYEFDSLEDFENYLSPEYESQDIISLSPSESTEIKEDFSMTPYDPDKRMSIRSEDFVDIDDMWDDLDLGILTHKEAKNEFLKSGDYPIWEVIQRDNGPVSVSTYTNGVIKVLPTAEEILARKRERKARTTLLMALPEDHLAKFHKIIDAKEMWEAIKSRFGGNDESKKIQKYILKQQFKGFSVSNSEGLHKGYDRFQSLLSQLEIHGAGVSTEDANQKVFESNVKVSIASSSSTQNVAFVSKNTSSTNDVSTAYGVSTSTGGHDFHENEEVLQKDRFNGNQDNRRIDAWNTGNKDKENGRRSSKQEEPKALVTLDGDGVDWTNDKTDVLTYHKKLLAEAEKEKEELKTKVEKWHISSKSLNILLNSQMSARDKARLGYGDQMNKGVLSYENEVFGSLVDSRSSDIEDSHVNDRYSKGMHAVPPPMTGIYIPFGPDKEIDDSQFTYGPKQSKPSESDTRSSDFNSYESNSSEETLESVP
ncbi:ribonuclease H-like domain-containing protein [Tanacetum coccineum]|uniref:Ribonuclease H-like domain-containing protein n=1 Tax=Tanacetum coccineum TaxID=301880 RepID=A0ABQ5EM20_9ASTR